MIVPNTHKSSLEELDTSTRSEMMELLSQSLQCLRKTYKAEAFNFGANIGSAAGAGIAGHMHIHVVPRWIGDTNFITTVGETRVIPEQLDKTCNRISAAWKKL